MRDALVVIDVITDFRHPDGEELLASFRERQPALRAAIESARAGGVPVVYVNDSHDAWDADVCRLDPAHHRVRSRGRSPRGGRPASGRPVPAQAPLLGLRPHARSTIVLDRLEIERVLLAGAATEMCIVQTAIDARELGLKVTILAPSCASVDPEDEAIALDYAERVVGARVER